ncbi:MAG: hypothetical protein OET90_04935 [Desulfuromonadales bacterium]|nr:hypothetical protein [Desulfuromonadales bacterium]
MTPSELANYDGRDGRQAYIAVSGTIYDVSGSPRWENGLHPPNHQAGQDLTEELATAPHVRAVVKRFPVVGTLEPEPQAPAQGSGGKVTIGIVVAAIIVGVVLFVLL